MAAHRRSNSRRCCTCSTQRAYLRGEQVSLKKYFYALRPLLAVRWIERHGSAPPIEFEKMLHLLDAARLPARRTGLAEEIFLRAATAARGALDRTPWQRTADRIREDAAPARRSAPTCAANRSR